MKPWESKTLWAALIVAIAGFIPPVGQWINEHPDYFSMVLGGLFGGLRLITKDKISIK